MSSEDEIRKVCSELADFLVNKNNNYGDSALDPVRVFSKADTAEQLRVRIDDKLSRLKRGSDAGEDVIEDLLGYLVLLKIQVKRLKPQPTPKHTSKALERIVVREDQCKITVGIGSLKKGVCVQLSPGGDWYRVSALIRNRVMLVDPSGEVWGTGWGCPRQIYGFRNPTEPRPKPKPKYVPVGVYITTGELDNLKQALAPKPKTKYVPVDSTKVQSSMRKECLISVYRDLLYCRWYTLDPWGSWVTINSPGFYAAPSKHHGTVIGTLKVNASGLCVVEISDKEYLIDSKQIRVLA